MCTSKRIQRWIQSHIKSNRDKVKAINKIQGHIFTGKKMIHRAIVKRLTFKLWWDFCVGRHMWSRVHFYTDMVVNIIIQRNRRIGSVRTAMLKKLIEGLDRIYHKINVRRIAII